MKADFGIMCRTLRVTKHLKQREVAYAIGIKPSTYGNVESSPHKCIRRDRVELLASFYNLAAADRAELLARWDRWPLSEFGERQKRRWEKRNKLRERARNVDRLRLSLAEMINIHIERNPVGLCRCNFGGGSYDDPTRSCEVCSALELLGMSNGWSDADRVMDHCIKIIDELTPKLFGKKPNGGTDHVGLQS